MLLTLSFFSSKALAETFLAETGQSDLEAMAQTMRRVFPDAAAEYARLGRTIHQVLLPSPGPDTGARPQQKVGRNDLCPCGSGRKYKKCCGAGT